MKKRALLPLLLAALLLNGCTASQDPVFTTTRLALDGQMAKAVTARVPQTALTLREPTAEEMRQEGVIGNVDPASLSPGGLHCRIQREYQPHETLGFRVHEASHVSCHDGNSLLWTVTVQDYVVQGWQMVREGVLLHGCTDVSLDAYGEEIVSWLTLVSHEGSVLWSQPLTPQLYWEDIAAAIDNGDGTYAVFGLCDAHSVLCVRQLSADGQLLSLTQTPLGDKGPFNILQVIALGDGYLMHVSPAHTGGEALLLLTKEGAVQNTACYQGSASQIRITDMAVQDGRLWLSAYAVANAAFGGGPTLRHYELNEALHSLPQQQTVTSEWLTPRLRRHYTALLLQADPDTLLPLRCISAEGCLGGSLATGADGKLQWHVESLMRTYYSPFTSSFTVSGQARIFRCTLFPNGSIQTEETGETALYVR